jgi:hypothetical protein
VTSSHKIVIINEASLGELNPKEIKTIDDNVTIENVLSLDNVSLEEVTLDDAMSCGFPLSWDTGEHGTGSFYFGCDDSTTMDDILSVIFALFW